MKCSIIEPNNSTAEAKAFEEIVKTNEMLLVDQKKEGTEIENVQWFQPVLNARKLDGMTEIRAKNVSN